MNDRIEPDGLLKRWEFWFGLIGALVAIASLVLALSERAGRLEAERLTKEETRLRQEAERATRSAEESLRVERDRVKDNLLLFVQEYVKRIQEIKNALSRHRETARSDDLRDARTSARALVAFIHKWRVVLAALEPRMNGTIDRLDQAVSSGDDAELEQLAGILSRNLESDLAALKAAIDALGPGAPVR